MKRFKILVFAVWLIWSCNNTSKAEKHEHNLPVATATSEEVNLNELNTVALTKEQQWKADINTNKNVTWLQKKASELKQQPISTVSDYHNISNHLQTGLNQLIKECRMKGPDHDALHLWLEPLLQETKDLKAVTDTVTGERLFHSIRTRLADYNFYFN